MHLPIAIKCVDFGLWVLLVAIEAIVGRVVEVVVRLGGGGHHGYGGCRCLLLHLGAGRGVVGRVVLGDPP